MNIFFDEENDGLILNENSLTYSYIPQKILYRDEEQSVIANSVKPLLHGRKPLNLLIHGKPGLGKTLCASFLMRQLEDYTNSVKPVMINCWEKNTEYSILMEIAKRLGCFFLQGKSCEEIFDEIFKKVNNINGLCIVFDEIDKAKEYGFLYRFLDKLEQKCCLILITNYKDFLFDLEPRIISRLSINELEFRPYTKEEVKGIIQERVRTAFGNAVFEKATLLKIVNETFKSEDIRTGLFLLLNSAKNAEQAGKKRVDLSDFMDAYKSLSNFRIANSLNQLNPDEKLIVDIVKENEGVISGKVYGLYKKSGGELSDRSFRRKLEKLERLELLRTESVGEGFKGRSRRIFLGKKLKSF